MFRPTMNQVPGPQWTTILVKEYLLRILVTIILIMTGNRRFKWTGSALWISGQVVVG